MIPSNRHAEISTKVRALCEKYDLPYTTGSLARQYLLTLRTIHKLALPDRFLRATADDAPETASELKFRIPFPEPVGTGPDSRSKMTFRHLASGTPGLVILKAKHHGFGCRFGNVSLLVDLRDRVRLVDLRDRLGPRRFAHGEGDPVAGVQGVQPRAILYLELFSRRAGVRARGPIGHILDRDSAADPVYSRHHSGPRLLG